METIVGLISTLFTLVFLTALVLAVLAVWSYNSLRRLAENVKEAQSNVDIALRKKVSLINRLSEMANQYREGEKLVMLKVSQDNSDAAMRDSYQQSTAMLATIQGMAQRFPELKATDQFKELLPAIDRAETDLQNWRVRCNATIKDYNSHRSALPHALYAGMLGFRPARYLELESVESSDSMIERSAFSDDGDQVKELLGMAGTKMLGATKSLASQGKLLAEKAATRVQTEMAARAAAAREFHYLDADRSPRGPVSRDELDLLFRSGDITQETDVLEAGAKSWTKYAALNALLNG
ncbi:MAG TPA: LemA family protein [Vicinamibacterales bacterium]|nr:LemA family protein [Vicinamibacterales bacterium]